VAGRKPIVFRAPARDDVAAAVDWLALEAGEEVAAGLVAELEALYERIAVNPAMGSPRWGNELNLPGLRHRALKVHPYLVFYVERAQRIEVVRVLHQARDIGSTLLADDAGG
jgi:toxin ParE1/3/4